MANSSLSVSSEIGQPCYLWSLPQEVQDMIFELAYPTETNLKICFKSDWDSHEEFQKKQDRANYKVRSFPPLKVTEFLVSKGFFISAAKAWISAQRWSDSSDSRGSVCVDNLLFKQNGLFLQFAQDVEVSVGLFPHLLTKAVSKMPNLRTLRLKLDDHNFDDVESKYAWEDVLEVSELDALAIVSELGKIRGLRTFQIVSGYCMFANTDTKKHILETNVKALEALIKPKATSAKVRSTTRVEHLPSGCLPMYHDSHVCFSCSKPHQQLTPWTQPLPYDSCFKRHQELGRRPQPLSYEQVVGAAQKAYEVKETTCLRGPQICNEDIPCTREGVLQMMKTQSELVVNYLLEARRKHMNERALQMITS